MRPKTHDNDHNGDGWVCKASGQRKATQLYFGRAQGKEADMMVEISCKANHLLKDFRQYTGSSPDNYFNPHQ